MPKSIHPDVTGGIGGPLKCMAGGDGRHWRPLGSGRTRICRRYRAVARAATGLADGAAQGWAAWPVALTRVTLAVALMVLAWAQLYADLLQCGAGSARTANGLFYLATAMAGFLLFDGLGVLWHGTVAFGRVFISQKALWASIGATSAMFAVMVLNLGGRCPCLLCVVPVCALARLLLGPLIDKLGQACTKVTSMLRRHCLDLDAIMRAVDGVPALGAPERRTLEQVAREVDHQMASKGSPEGRAWGEADLQRFLRRSEAALQGPGHGHPWSAVDAWLFQVIENLGSVPAARNNYGIFAALSSGLRQLARGGARELSVFCIVGVADGCLGPLQAWLISLLTKAAMDGDRDTAAYLIPAYLGSYALGSASYFTLVYLFSAVLSKGTASVQRHVAAKMLAMGSTERSAYPAGSVNAIFASDITRLQDLWTGVIWQLLSPLMKVLIAILYATYASPQVGMLALTVFPLIFLTVPQTRSSSVAAAHSAANSETISMFQNGAACQPMLWSCDKQGEWMRRSLEPRVEDQRRKHMGMRLWGGIVQAYVQQLVGAFVAVHVAILAWLAATGGLSVAEFTGFVSLFSSLGTPSISLGGFYRVAVASAGSAQRVDEFLQGTDPTGKAGAPAQALGAEEDEDLEDPRSERVQVCRHALYYPPGDLVVDGVSYQYPGAAKPAIEGVSFSVCAGSFTAVMGGSGCGKSTLLSLLGTWLRPTSGCVSIGQSLSWGPGGGQGEQHSAVIGADAARRIRDKVAVVFQETMLLAGTVHENIAISAVGEVSRDVVEWAATAAGCADFINSQLPDGYDTVLGAEGASLSGGQAQRICIARALCRKPSVLLLDEATSALDPETAAQILETIAGLKSNYPSVFGSLTVVSVTHHPGMLKYADLIIHMDSGHVRSVVQNPRKHKLRTLDGNSLACKVPPDSVPLTQAIDCLNQPDLPSKVLAMEGSPEFTGNLDNLALQHEMELRVSSGHQSNLMGG